MSQPAERPRVLPAVLGALVGAVIATIVGAFLITWALRASGEASGWEDLAGPAVSIFSFGPLGLAVGALIGEPHPTTRSLSARRASSILSTLTATVTSPPQIEVGR